MIKYHNLKKELPKIEEKRFFAIVIDNTKHGSDCRYDTIRIMKYAPPYIGYRVKFGDGCVEYDAFCKDDTRNIYWFDIDHKEFLNSLYGVENHEILSTISSIIEQKGEHG